MLKKIKTFMSFNIHRRIFNWKYSKTLRFSNVRTNAVLQIDLWNAFNFTTTYGGEEHVFLINSTIEGITIAYYNHADLMADNFRLPRNIN